MSQSTPNNSSADPALSWPERYSEFIEAVIVDTMKGRIASKEQVYRRLSDALEGGSVGEIFERCLLDRQAQVQEQQKSGTEMEQAKALRQSRALKVLAGAWERWQQENQAKSAANAAIAQLQATDPEDRLSVLFQILDPNQTYVFNRKQIRLLANDLSQADSKLQPLAQGLDQGLKSFEAMEPHLIGWMYDAPQRAVGFESSRQQVSPWKYWSQKTNSSLAQELFAGQVENRSAYELAETQSTVDLAGWIELAILLRGMQGGLIAWFDKQPYSLTGGRNLAAMTFLTFAQLWSELSGGFRENKQLPHSQAEALARSTFQVALQILRAFAQRDTFPLYGGVLASFSGESFRETMGYLDRPLRALDNTQEKARILTLLAYSQGWMGDVETSLELHYEALELAQSAEDQRCAIANLNHISRAKLKQQDYEGAIAQGQRALILARQTGDQQGEAQAIVSTGYSEVQQAQAQERPNVDRLALTVEQLRQALQRAEKVGDRVSQTLCSSGLGQAYLLLGRNRAAQESLELAIKLALQTGNAELHGLCRVYLAEALYQQNEETEALLHGCLGMYLTEQRGGAKWRQAAGIVSLIQGKRGEEAFSQALQSWHQKIVSIIGVDGFDHLPVLLERYQAG